MSQRRLSVVGLGYVGLPVAVAFAQVGFEVIGFDSDAGRVAELKAGHDRTAEVAAADLALPTLTLTDEAAPLAGADFHVIAAPTPIDAARRPDLGALLRASATVGHHLKPGGIVVYESTVYPGATEEDCLPVLERASGLVGGRDFGLGYSPERINPGDRAHRFATIRKIIAAGDAATLAVMAEVYGRVVTAGLHPAPSIRTAEAAKVLENTQRDLNIALMNEMAMICARLDLDTHDVLAAAASKWNFLPFTPGLVGGHCVGVDPYYLTDRAQRAGHHPEVILAGRRINDGMAAWIARETVKRLRAGGRPPRVHVLGVTFKEDVPDYRNSRVFDLIAELRAFGVVVAVHDPLANAEALARDYGLVLAGALEELPPADAVILAVAHRAYREGGWPLISDRLNANGLVVDIKAILSRAETPATARLWRP